MPNFDGCKAFRVPEWGSLIESGDPTLVPLARAVVARNVKHTGFSVRTRDGLKTTWGSINADSPLRGLAFLEVQGATRQQYPILYTQDGRLEYESPVGAGAGVQLLNAALVDIPANAEMLSTSAFTREYMSFSDLKRGTHPPCVFDSATRTLNPLSHIPVGSPWQAATAYKVGDIISPSEAGNGHLYRCTIAGTSGAAAPVFPVGGSATVMDNGVEWTEATPAIADTVAAGNICVGKHYAAVLFQTRTGYIWGLHNNAVIEWTAAGGKQARISGLWVGPEDTIARIVILTVAGAPKAGPYFYIDEADSVEGVSISAMVVNDNVTTEVTFNVTDDYLVTGVDVTDYFRKIKVPPCAAIYFDSTLNALVYSGAQGYESGHLVSNGSDPETVYGDTGIVQVSQQDGQRTVGWCEWNGLHLSLKEDSGHVVTISGENPAAWAVVERWSGCGPAGPMAWDKCERFLAFGHRSGVYLFFGDIPWPVVGGIIDKLWSRINWEHGHKIWCTIDDDAKEVLFGVPLDQSTECNVILKLNYQGGFESPIASDRRKRQLFFKALKWSVDDIAASRAVVAKRDLANPNPANPLDQRIAHRQLLFASNYDDGAVNMQVPDQLDDNGQGIDSRFRPGWADAGGALLQLGGVQVSAKGTGDLGILLYACDEEAPTLDLGDWNLEEYKGRDIAVEDTGTSERWSMEFTNRKQKGAGFELRRATLWAQPLFAGREG